MKKIISIAILLLAGSLYANTFQCHDVYTTMTTQKGTAPYQVEGTKGNGNTKLSIEFKKEKVVLTVKAQKEELIYLGKGQGTMYLLEQTTSGNNNLYTIFDDGTLTISKSYDVFGMAKVNVQTMYKCQ